MPSEGVLRLFKFALKRAAHAAGAIVMFLKTLKAPPSFPRPAIPGNGSLISILVDFFWQRRADASNNCSHTARPRTHIARRISSLSSALRV